MTSTKTSTTINVDCDKCPATHKVYYSGQYRYRRVFDCHCGHRIVVSRYNGGDILISGGRRREGNESAEFS